MSGGALAERDPFDFSEFGTERSGEYPTPDPEPGTQPDRGERLPGHDLGAGFDPLPSTGGRAAPLAVAGPPMVWLGISAAVAVIGLVLAAVLGALPPMAVIGWVLAGPLAIGALAVYTSSDTRRRAQPIYVAPNWLAAAYYACLGVCLIGVVVSAIRIALWVGRW